MMEGTMPMQPEPRACLCGGTAMPGALVCEACAALERAAMVEMVYGHKRALAAFLREAADDLEGPGVTLDVADYEATRPVRKTGGRVPSVEAEAKHVTITVRYRVRP